MHLRTLLSMGLIAASCVGCAAKVEQIGGITGKAEAGGKPLPERTTLTFYSQQADSNFTAYVDAQGNYRYVPAPEIPVVLGKYKVAISPPAPQTINKDGLSLPDPNWKPVKIPNFDKKYQKKETTPLEVELTSSQETFDIKI
ncbi:hypothetical protein SH661x_001644 [Planctomicrobium sp. SH661]|uniref:hypothetical protein n=1 Tax=Planctomicrobium sp. SH661 TaxID=3448124 RepID=UPI003F5BFA0B